MLARPYRLTEESEFIKVKRKGKKYDHPLFAWIVLKRGDKEFSKFGIVVSTKISKLANKRNYLRRVLSEAIRQSISTIKPGYDTVILTKTAIANKYTEEIMRGTREMLKKTGIVKE